MNERKACKLIEKFPDWIAGSRPDVESNRGTYAWAMIKAECAISRIQWFIHVLYNHGYEIRKKK